MVADRTDIARRPQRDAKQPLSRSWQSQPPGFVVNIPPGDDQFHAEGFVGANAIDGHVAAYMPGALVAELRADMPKLDDAIV